MGSHQFHRFQVDFGDGVATEVRDVQGLPGGIDCRVATAVEFDGVGPVTVPVAGSMTEIVPSYRFTT